MPLNADRNRLRRVGGAEALHRAFALPGRLVTVLGPVVQALVGAVLHRRHHLAVGGTVGADLAGHDHPRHRLGVLQQIPEESPGRGSVAPGLGQNVQHVPVGVDGPHR